MHQLIDDVKQGNIFIIDYNENVRNATVKLREMGYGAAIVMENSILKGIFTERDILYKVVANDLTPSSVLVKDIMVKNVMTVSGSENVFNALNLLRENKIRRLVVVDNDGKVTGIVSIRDLMFSLMNDLQEENDLLGEFLIEEISHDIDELKKKNEV